MTKEYTILSSEVYLIRYLYFSFVSEHELGERKLDMTQFVTFILLDSYSRLQVFILSEIETRGVLS